MIDAITDDETHPAHPIQYTSTCPTCTSTCKCTYTVHKSGYNINIIKRLSLSQHRRRRVDEFVIFSSSLVFSLSSSLPLSLSPSLSLTLAFHRRSPSDTVRRMESPRSADCSPEPVAVAVAVAVSAMEPERRKPCRRNFGNDGDKGGFLLFVGDGTRG